jgi:hypothetical protein
MQVPELQLPIRFAIPVGGELMESLPGLSCSAAILPQTLTLPSSISVCDAGA